MNKNKKTLNKVSNKDKNEKKFERNIKTKTKTQVVGTKNNIKLGIKTTKTNFVENNLLNTTTKKETNIESNNLKLSFLKNESIHNKTGIESNIKDDLIQQIFDLTTYCKNYNQNELTTYEELKIKREDFEKNKQIECKNKKHGLMDNNLIFSVEENNNEQENSESFKGKLLKEIQQSSEERMNILNKYLNIINSCLVEFDHETPFYNNSFISNINFDNRKDSKDSSKLSIIIHDTQNSQPNDCSIDKNISPDKKRSSFSILQPVHDRTFDKVINSARQLVLIEDKTVSSSETISNEDKFDEISDLEERNNSLDINNYKAKLQKIPKIKTDFHIDIPDTIDEVKGDVFHDYINGDEAFETFRKKTNTISLDDMSESIVDAKEKIRASRKRKTVRNSLEIRRVNKNIILSINEDNRINDDDEIPDEGNNTLIPVLQTASLNFVLGCRNSNTLKKSTFRKSNSMIILNSINSVKNTVKIIDKKKDDLKETTATLLNSHKVTNIIYRFLDEGSKKRIV